VGDALAIMAKIMKGGKLLIPAPMRSGMVMRPGDAMVVELVSGSKVRVRPLASAIREPQEIVRRSVTQGRSLADELMCERRR
jgi:bifunctional DNA-binding transcriptional regulator/antitoxin component of YhaV-PrlF toxin-antitoxin module